MAFGDIVQTNTGTSTLATTSPTLLGAIAAGNLVVLEFVADDYDSGANTGWTKSTGQSQESFHGAYQWWFLGAGGDAVPSYTIGSAARSTWRLTEFAGPFDASPFDIANGQIAAASGGAYSTPAITPTSGERLLVASINCSHDSTESTTWTGWTDSFAGDTHVFNGANPRICLGRGYRVVTGDGVTAFSTTSGTLPVHQCRSGMIVAFKAGAGPGPTPQIVVSGWGMKGQRPHSFKP